MKEVYPSVEKYMKKSQGEVRLDQVLLSLERTRHFNVCALYTYVF
jgi:hypothetical protein